MRVYARQKGVARAANVRRTRATGVARAISIARVLRTRVAKQRMPFRRMCEARMLHLKLREGKRR